MERWKMVNVKRVDATEMDIRLIATSDHFDDLDDGDEEIEAFVDFMIVEAKKRGINIELGGGERDNAYALPDGTVVMEDTFEHMMFEGQFGDPEVVRGEYLEMRERE